MKVLKIIEAKSKGRFFLDEYSNEFGTIEFVGTKGGSISNCYFYRFDKTTEINRDKEGNILSKRASFIDFYINKESHKLQHIDFVSLRLFEVEINDEIRINFDSQKYYLPIIDISTWVSSLGSLRAFSYDDTKYLNTQDNIDVKIIHNRGDSIQFLFGEIDQTFAMNETLYFSIDSNNNLTALTIIDNVEVKKLTTIF